MQIERVAKGQGDRGEKAVTGKEEKEVKAAKEGREEKEGSKKTSEARIGEAKGSQRVDDGQLMQGRCRCDARAPHRRCVEDPMGRTW